jgi:hypothetical protein
LEEFLLRVHRGLVHGEFAVQAPLKYRSLQLTGREKRLGELAQTGLFGLGRLNLELLGCFSETPPMACETLSDAPTLIVFENADSFAVARNVLRSLASPPFGMVGFGGGNGIARSLPSLRVLGKQVQRIAYVGDLDGHGLRIAGRERTCRIWNPQLSYMLPCSNRRHALVILMDGRTELCNGQAQRNWQRC